MKTQRHGSRHTQRGLVLASSLLLLLVVTVLAVSMFRSFGIQERIASNIREKQRALHAAESAQQYAEWWLSTGTGPAPVVCNALLDANLDQGQVCSNDLRTIVADVTQIPWQLNGADVGVGYTPPDMTVTATSAMNTYYATPRFYIGDLGRAATGQGEVYRINAVGYGGGADSVAVVESTFSVYLSSWSLE